ncbi:MAG: tRNA (adenosine(37)-N6)-dimethylallyltransferase MiaA [Candidatus Parcubacteria bacterium]|nr:tRNA (adenosine(37)-N6)-dimethylallyltransferase MiaA [Burkholderiales bacterium]
MAEERRPTAYVLLGPTASGKSRWAQQVAIRNECEIISMDSAQVYRGMDIGTAKPSIAARRAVPYHLVDLIEPTESYSAGRFREDAIRLVAEIDGRRKIPLIVGGTMLYFRALTQGFDDLPQADPEIRAQLDREAAERGWPALHAELAQVDPETAARLKPGDGQRIQRALEVFRSSGKTLSSLQSGRKYLLPFDLWVFEMEPLVRAELHRRIEERFDRMLKAGLVNELRELRGKYNLSAQMPSMRAVGYRQAWRFLEGEISERELRETGIAATRQLAKRQLTWLRGMPEFSEAEWMHNAIQGR